MNYTEYYTESSRFFCALSPLLLRVVQLFFFFLMTYVSCIVSQTKFSQGPFLLWAPRSQQVELGFLFPQLPSLRDVLSDHPIYIPTNKYRKTTWNQRSQPGSKARN